MRSGTSITAALLVAAAVGTACRGDGGAGGASSSCVAELGVIDGASHLVFVDYDRARSSGFLQPVDDLGPLDPAEQRATADHYFRLRQELGLQMFATFEREVRLLLPIELGVRDVRCAVASLRDGELIRLVDGDDVQLDRGSAVQDGDLLAVSWEEASPVEVDRSPDAPLARALRHMSEAGMFQGTVMVIEDTREVLGYGVARAGDRNEFVIVRSVPGAADAELQATAELAVAMSEERGTDDGVLDYAGATVEVADGASTTRLTLLAEVPMARTLAAQLDPLVLPGHLLD